MVYSIKNVIFNLNNLCIAMMNIMLKSFQIEFTPHLSSHGQNVSERLIYFKLFFSIICHQNASQMTFKFNSWPKNVSILTEK